MMVNVSRDRVGGAQSQRGKTPSERRMDYLRDLERRGLIRLVDEPRDKYLLDKEFDE